MKMHTQYTTPIVTTPWIRGLSIIDNSYRLELLLVLEHFPTCHRRRSILLYVMASFILEVI